MDATEDAISTNWTIEDSRELYNVDGWGIGYFGINPKGHVTVHPTKDTERGLDLFELATDLEQQGVGLPVLLRFSDILRTRIETLTDRFRTAIREFEYTGRYTTVYPIKVNQQRHVVEEIVAFGEPHGVGLEVGSKPELQAVLALTERTDHLIVCNGYKDEEYVRLALMGQKLGHKVLIVLEKINEVDILLKVAREMDVEPTAGVRVKLSTAGAGKWSESAGEKSKFGLNSSQLVRVLDKLEAAGKLGILRMLHFHLGSQIPDIRNVKLGMTEVSRFYVELRQLGVQIEYVDVGGGLGVDYDGSRSTTHASVNYSIQEYANDIIYSLAEASREAEVPMPHVISESGRALTAHHALLLINVIDLETQIAETPEEVPEGETPEPEKPLNSMKPIWARSPSEVTQEEYADFYRQISHDWSEPLETLHTRGEGLVEFQAVLFIPSRGATELYYPGFKPNLRLYVKRMLVRENSEELLPRWLRWVRGAVDSPDLPLNVSREMLQSDRHVRQIRRVLTKKVLDALKKMQEGDRAKYETFWRELGRAVKEGVDSDFENR
ncbi:MAG TPA: biosynthetic arginine decarboxylase, partial [Longimicrobiaceae bacterium]|nr:biosynthetic arginine decarboxylase [Longimicrobiaceae bacterium]